MQRIGYIKGPAALSAWEVEAFDRLFDGYLIASEAEAMDALFLAIEKGPSKRLRERKTTF
jgi:hypothetical protein